MFTLELKIGFKIHFFTYKNWLHDIKLVTRNKPSIKPQNNEGERKIWLKMRLSQRKKMTNPSSSKAKSSAQSQWTLRYGY